LAGHVVTQSTATVPQRTAPAAAAVASATAQTGDRSRHRQYRAWRCDSTSTASSILAREEYPQLSIRNRGAEIHRRAENASIGKAIDI
jgi:hypothetical protein